MSAAPKGASEADELGSAFARNRIRADGKLNAEGLHSRSHGKGERESRLVASMKQRHGAK